MQSTVHRQQIKMVRDGLSSFRFRKQRTASKLFSVYGTVLTDFDNGSKTDELGPRTFLENGSLSKTYDKGLNKAVDDALR